LLEKLVFRHATFEEAVKKAVALGRENEHPDQSRNESVGPRDYRQGRDLFPQDMMRYGTRIVGGVTPGKEVEHMKRCLF
jgi:hypothetical protein